MAKPTSKQVKAVHGALYKRARLQKLQDLQRQVATLMNLNPDATLQQNDIRNPPGSGPNWYIAATGAVDDPVQSAADLCDEIAKTILQMRSDVANVDFPAADKKHLTAALKEEAASWSARGDAWRSAAMPNAGVLVDEIDSHVQACVDEVKKVGDYLKTKEHLGL